jgi:hypothetical protein
MRHIIPISGKDSLATALHQHSIQPDLPYEYVFNPTGSELPETFEWIKKVEAYLGKPIHLIGENLIEIIEGYNFFLPSRWSRYCTKESKIQPFEKWIGKDPCIVYYGIRADEKRIGYNNNRYPNIEPAYPLQTAGIAIDQVYKIVTDAGIPPPVFFWKRLYDAVCKGLGGDLILKQFLAKWQTDFLFAWRSRTNCYHCFNLKKYEWLGLLEHHPDLFWKAEAMEHHQSEYFWNGKNYPLTKVVENQADIFNRRVKAIIQAIKAIQYSRANPLLQDFMNNHVVDDLLNTTSCGLFCGK